MKYKRSPRMQQKLPSEDIILAAPPASHRKYEKSRGVIASLFGSGAMFGASMLTGTMSPALLAARAASLVMPISSAASSGSNDKKRKKSFEQYEAMRHEKYGAYIDEQKARIEAIARIQREILTEENPDPEICIENVAHLNRSLWERMPSDRDYLDVRVGMGYEKLCVNVKSRTDSNGFQLESDEVRSLPIKSSKKQESLIMYPPVFLFCSQQYHRNYGKQRQNNKSYKKYAYFADFTALLQRC